MILLNTLWPSGRESIPGSCILLDSAGSLRIGSGLSYLLICGFPLRQRLSVSLRHQWTSGFDLVLWVCYGLARWISLFSVVWLLWIQSSRLVSSHSRISGLGLICLRLSLFPLDPAQQLPLSLFRGVVAMEPTTATERKRAVLREAIVLTGDRVATEITRTRREKLLKNFGAWLLSTHGVSLHYLLEERPADPEKISKWLVAYGNDLFAAGKAYGVYAETINSVTAARPILKKGLVQAWDLAFSWVAGEPFDHHPAMPASVLLAIMAICFSWGWPREAAIFGLTWCGMLRIGEVLQSRRADLVLPRDAAPGTRFAYESQRLEEDMQSAKLLESTNPMSSLY